MDVRLIARAFAFQFGNEAVDDVGTDVAPLPPGPLKPGGKLVFSFLELTNPSHYERIFENRVARLRRNKRLKLLDTFLHRDWIALWAEKIGYSEPEFTAGNDWSKHPEMWQTLAAMTKPA